MAATSPPRPEVASRKPWFWVPSLYFAQGIPFVVVMSLSVVMYKRLGISNTDIAAYTSLLYLPWVIKPLWSPLIDSCKTKRLWIVAMQFLVSLALIAAGFAAQTKVFFFLTLAFFCIMAFSSATHDIAADGFYMLGLSRHDQVWWVGIRSAFYRLASIVGSGLLVMLAGFFEDETGNNALAWSITFQALAGIFLLFWAWHSFILPRPATDQPVRSGGGMRKEFIDTWVSFFKKTGIVPALAFILLYRFAEAQSGKMLSPFLLDQRELGGVGLTTKQVGLAYGTIGVAAMISGGIVGGLLAARRGLKAMLPVMVCAIHLPNLALVYLSFAQPENFHMVCACIAVEQFGYGFGFAGYMLYMIYFADGAHRTAHYAICTGFMALGMMLPGAVSGKLQAFLGYQHFFVWVMLATIPGFLVAFFVKVDPQFGRKMESPKP